MVEQSKASLHSMIDMTSNQITSLVGAGMGSNPIHSHFADIPQADKSLLHSVFCFDLKESPLSDSNLLFTIGTIL